MRISGSMISWNEASAIDLAIRDVAEFVDELVVADTGSFDGTRIIVQDLMDELDISGQIKDIKVTNIKQARRKSINMCSYETVLLVDSNIVFSEQLKREIMHFIRKHESKRWLLGRPKLVGMASVKTVNFMGDYLHIFGDDTYKDGYVFGHHRILFDRDSVDWDRNIDKPWPKRVGIIDPQPSKLSGVSFNLSRVRPAWRIWYRGEPFDPKYFRRDKRGIDHSENRQYAWLKVDKYYSLKEYAEGELNISFEDVQKIAPGWFLEHLKRSAVPISYELKKELPNVILDELQSPRYELVYDKGEIVGRKPTL